MPSSRGSLGLDPSSPDKRIVNSSILLDTEDDKEIKPVKPKGSQPSIFIGRTDAEAETPVLWPPDAKCQLIGKDPDARKD